MPSPTLSPTERQRISDAAKLDAVKWRAFGMKLSYVAGGKEHPVLSAGSRRIFEALCRQAEVFYREAHAETARAAQAVEATD